MNNNDGARSILSTIVSSILFLVTLLLFKWHFLVSAGLSILTYFGVLLVTAPIKKIGNVSVEKIDQGERISRIYEQANENIRQINKQQTLINDKEVFEKIGMLSEKGSSIMNYLSNNYKAISASEHFLEYYLGTANRIIKNFAEMQNTSISESKSKLIRNETLESLDYLQDIFTRQLDSYYEDKILSLEIESDLLEKTVKLGGGIE